MWVKRQNGTDTLDVVRYYYTWKTEDRYVKQYVQYVDVYQIRGFCINDPEYDCLLGTYTTEAKAKRVLRLMDKHLEKRAVKKAIIPSDALEGIIIENQNLIWEIISCLPNHSIFYMPQDEEVNEDEE